MRARVAAVPLSAPSPAPEPRPASDAPSRRERRKAETRGKLLGAARSLFATDGYDATRPQDIARAADLAIGTFYVHFPDKRAAFLAFTDAASHELMERVRAHIGDARGFEARLLGSLEAIVAFSDENPGVLAAAFADEAVLAADLPSGASLRDRLAQSLANHLREGMRRNELRRDYDPSVVAYGIVGLVQQGLRFGANARIPRAALLDNLVRFCARALVAPQARRARKESR
ncbi:MAG TPA: TetR/AcrR family transcriptional regulator [Myxococcota bacterium]|nr:TetR/AcrR family transcriptional regulator [Myxococcota bacterium]